MIKPTTVSTAVPETFQIEWVFGAMSETLRQQIVAFWLDEAAVPNPDEAWRRSWEVACVLLVANTREIAGVCTVAIRLDEQGVSYGFIRLYIRPASRRLGLNRRLIRTVVDGFEAMASQPGAPRRLIITLENRKLERKAAQRGLARLGFVQAGTTPNGEVVIERLLASIPPPR